jgi:hypothetical protein
MSGEEFEKLVEDIRHHGLREPVVLAPDGSILDGRNREAACLLLGIEPRFETFSGDPVAYVISLNLHRRHLDESQRAMVAAKLATMRQGQRTDLAQICAKSQAEAAELLNVSRRSLQHAAVVREEGAAELIAAVEHGDIAVSAAAQLAEQPIPIQSDVIGQIHAGSLPPTKSGIQAMLAGYTGSVEWYTPAEWIECARTVMGGIDCDPASSAFAQRTVQAKEWFDKNQDGLKFPWHGNVWLNPPYAKGQIEPFIEKLISERCHFEQAIVLVDNRTDTQWFRELCSVAKAVAFTTGRIQFYNENGAGVSPTNGSALVYVGPRVEDFRRTFADSCIVARLFNTPDSTPDSYPPEIDAYRSWEDGIAALRERHLNQKAEEDDGDCP